MSAPHAYVTDRLCFVLSGTWWVNSGENFEPDATVPVAAGGFVRRVAHTPHCDGVKKDDKEPAVIAIFGEAPTNVTWLDPRKPPWCGRYRGPLFGAGAAPCGRSAALLRRGIRV